MLELLRVFQYHVAQFIAQPSSPWSILWVLGPLCMGLTQWCHSCFPYYRHGRHWDLPIMQGRGMFVTLYMTSAWFGCLRAVDPALGCQSVAAHAATISRISAAAKVHVGSVLSRIYLGSSLLTFNLIYHTELYGMSRNRVEKSLLNGDRMCVYERIMRVGLAFTMLGSILPHDAHDCFALPERNALPSGQAREATNPLAVLQPRPHAYTTHILWPTRTQPRTVRTQVSTPHCVLQICHKQYLAELHSCGMFLGLFLSIIGCGLRLRETLRLVPRAALGGAQHSGRRMKRALFLLLFIVLALWVSVAAFLAAGTKAHDSARMYFCINHETKAACEGAAWKEYSRAFSGAERRLLRSQWPCQWNSSALGLNEIACTNPSCTEHLWYNQLSIVCEFFVIAFWMTGLAYAYAIIRHIEVEECLGQLPRAKTRLLLKGQTSAFASAETLLDAPSWSAAYRLTPPRLTPPPE